ncbi:MAG: LutC/YkgG family protein [Terracidiphilus sp.]|jgi:L-lactate dehydrogenase complex protein LldG
MSTSSSREAILGRIRAATRSSATAAERSSGAVAMLPRDYQMRGELTVRACLELFMERLREYDAKVVECAPDELPATIAAQIEASGKRRFVAPSGIPSAWLVTAAWQISGFECDIDHGLTAAEIEKAEGVMTACFCGVADSGTIVLHHSATEGRRVITLLPDWHLCIVLASQIVETLPEYFDRCGNAGTEGPRDQGNEKAETKGPRNDGEKALPPLVTWISGPSATADIEMTRIKGVHGPRFLNVIVVNDREQGKGTRD